MARYRGPRVKICRALGTVLPGLTTISTLDRPFPPGEHGTRRRSKVSDYKIRLVEKQKMRFHYGILEKQFKRYVSQAVRNRGPTGEILLSMLESRLDNVIWRIGLAPTIPAARQMVVHGHITIDGKRVDRPSFQVKVGTEIAICAKSKEKPFILERLEQSTTRLRPSYMEFDPAKAAGRLVAPPDPSEIPLDVDTQAVVEYYSQQL
jgi:small subunit ribosomal protein S4